MSDQVPNEIANNIYYEGYDDGYKDGWDEARASYNEPVESQDEFLESLPENHGGSE